MNFCWEANLKGSLLLSNMLLSIIQSFKILVVAYAHKYLMSMCGYAHLDTPSNKIICIHLYFYKYFAYKKWLKKRIKKKKNKKKAREISLCICVHIKYKFIRINMCACFKMYLDTVCNKSRIYKHALYHSASKLTF